MSSKIKLPPVGMRIIKSAMGVFLCYLIYILRGQNGIPFYSMIAALQCIQPYTDKTHEIAAQRFTGTVIGALSGLIAILIEIYVLDIYNNFAGYLLNTLFVIPVIYATVLLKKQNVSYFSCVVYLSIAVNHMTDPNPFIFVMNRVLDTFIGISVGIIVNHMRLPRKKVKNCLFVTSLDDMISPVRKEISSYSRIEINRMIESGMNFTIATMRTPASLIEPVSGINLKMPVIVMDGAALYDIKENTFLNAYVISNESSSEIAGKIRGYGMNCFVNALCDDTLVIFYRDLENPAEKGMFQNLKRSPYRSYVHREPAGNDRTIYIMAVDRTEKIEAFHKLLLDEEYDKRFKIISYESDDYEGYSCIKIYNKNANTQNMIRYLVDALEIDRKITIGRGQENDISAESSDFNSIIKILRRTYEPFVLSKNIIFRNHIKN